MAYLRRANVSTANRLTVLVLGVALFFGVSTYFATAHAMDGTQAQTETIRAFQELIEVSQKEKKGLTFFVSGQTIAGLVVRTIGNEAVEVRSQTYSRVIIRLASVDAVAVN